MGKIKEDPDYLRRMQGLDKGLAHLLLILENFEGHARPFEQQIEAWCRDLGEDKRPSYYKYQNVTPTYIVDTYANRLRRYPRGRE